MLAGYLPGRIHRAVPSHKDRQVALRRPVAALIKHDGFRIIARKSDGRVQLYSRPGNDMTRRSRLIAEALMGLRSPVVHYRWGSRRVR